MHYKGYKIRLYPTKEQESLIRQHFGASRFIWNYMLELQERNHSEGGKFLTGFDMTKLLTPLKQKQEYDWIKSVSSKTLSLTCINLSNAYKRFFNGCGLPRFKSKKQSKCSCPVRSDSIYFDDKKVNIEKIGKVKYKSDFMFIEKAKMYKNARLIYENGKYILAFVVECESQAQRLNDYTMGIDLGVKELAVVAYDDKQLVFHNINKSQKMKLLDKRIRRLHRSISRQYEMSKKCNNGKYVKTNNIVKRENKLRRLHAKVKNIRTDYTHQVTHKLVEKLPMRVIMEDLNVHGMMKNRHLSKAICSQSFHTFKYQMKYKCERVGIEFVLADRFYPSSKICSRCGEKKHDLKLRDRMYICSKCGLRIDREYNAAINLMRYEA